MKRFIILSLATTLLFSCKKDSSPSQTEHEHKNYRVYFTSKSQHDTTYTPTRGARVETTGLDSVADSKLKMVLLSYDGHGVFTVAATNLTPCQGILRWNWDGNFKIDSIGYPSNNPIDPKNDVLATGETKIFKLYCQPKIGRLKLQLKGNCGNSSELIINITTSILPIKYLDYTVSYNDKLGKHVISFSVDDPADVDWVIVEQLVGNQYKWVYGIPGDDKTKQYTIKL